MDKILKNTGKSILCIAMLFPSPAMVYAEQDSGIQAAETITEKAAESETPKDEILEVADDPNSVTFFSPSDNTDSKTAINPVDDTIYAVLGDQIVPELTFASDELAAYAIDWTSEDQAVVEIRDNKMYAAGEGCTTVNGISEYDGLSSVSMTVFVSDEWGIAQLKLEKARMDLTDKTGAGTTVRETLKLAEEKYADAKYALDRAQARIADPETDPSDEYRIAWQNLKDASAELALAKNEKDIAENKILTAVSAYDRAKAERDSEAENLADTQAKSDTLQNELAAVKASKDETENELLEWQNTLLQAQNDEKTAQGELAEAKSNKEKADSELVSAEMDLKTAETACNDQLAVVNGKSAIVDQKTAAKESAESNKASALETVKAAQEGVDQAQAAYDNALQEAQDRVTAAHKAIDDAQAQINKGSYGFFEDQGATEAMSIIKYMTSSAIKKSRNITLGKEGDATDLDLMKISVDMIGIGNKLRTADNNFKNRGALKITNTMMAIAQANAAHQRDVVKHWVNEDGGLGKKNSAWKVAENLAWGNPLPYEPDEYSLYYEDLGMYDSELSAYDGWYVEEKGVYDGTLTDVSHPQTGHYINMMNRYMELTGFAIAYSDEWEYVYAQEFHYGTKTHYYYEPWKQWMDVDMNDLKDNKSYTVDEYRALLDDYCSRIEAAKVDAEAELADALEALEEFKNSPEIYETYMTAVDAAKEELQNAQAVLDTANDALTAAEKDLADAQAELEDEQMILAEKEQMKAEAEEAAEEKSSNVADAQMIVDEKTEALEAVHTRIEKAENNITLIKENIGKLEEVITLKEVMSMNTENILRNMTAVLEEKEQAVTEAEDNVAAAEALTNEQDSRISEKQAELENAKAVFDAVAVDESASAAADLETVKSEYDAAAQEYEEAITADADHPADEAEQMFNEALEQYYALKDRNAVKKTIEQINALDPVSSAEEDIRSAREAYRRLRDDLKEQVINLSALEAAEETMRSKKTEEEDRITAQLITKQIDAIGDVTVDSENEIHAVRKIYNDLSVAQQSFVSNEDVLENSESLLEDLKADESIKNLFSAISYDDYSSLEEQVKAAKEIYDALPEKQKELVTDRYLLDYYMELLANAETEKSLSGSISVNEVMKRINALPVKPTIEDEEAVTGARKAYEALTDEQKALVTNLAILEDIETTFSVVEKKANSVWIQNISDKLVQKYTGSAITLKGYDVYFGERLLKEGTDYTVKYTNNKNAGTAKMSISLKGNYAKYYQGSTTIEFTIEPVDLSSDPGISAENITSLYTGKNQTAKPAVSFNGKALAAKNNYTVSQPVMKEVGVYEVTITGIGPNFTGSRSITYTIVPKVDAQVITKTTVKIPALDYGTTLADLEQMFREGTATVKDGKKTLVYGEDYTIRSSAVFNRIGTVNVAIIGSETESAVTGKTYYGIKSVNAKVTGTVLTAKMVNLEYTSSEYTGRAQKPEIITDGLIEGTDYIAVYTNNTSIGTAAVQITGIGKYTGTIKKTFKISAAKPSEVFAVENEGNLSAEYINGGAKPVIRVRDKRTKILLKEGIDYSISYSNNKTPGSYGTAKISGLGNYAVKKDTKNVTFMVTEGDVSELIISAPDKAYAKKKGNWQTTLKVLDANGKALSAKTDYTIVYTCNGEVLTSSSIVEAGDVIEVTVTGKGKYSSASITAEYRILNKAEIKNISSAKVTVKPAVYTGKELEPAVTVTVGSMQLTEGVDYEVESYSNNINPSKNALVIIRGIGDYSGTKTQKFTIQKATDETWWSNILSVFKA